MPQLLTNLAGLSMVFLPLTFSWAIVRYRLMDTDLIFKRGVAYTLATGLLLGAYFGIIALIALWWSTPACPTRCASGAWALHSGGRRHLRPPQAQNPGLGRPRFDRHRYDYRKALVEFGRGLSSETDLQALLESIVERLPRTLLVARVAVFLADGFRPPAPGRLARAAPRGAATAQDQRSPWASWTSIRPRPLPHLP
jgi:two-component system NtrC family sensor kinase